MAQTALEKWKEKYTTKENTKSNSEENKSARQNENSASALEQWKEKYSTNTKPKTDTETKKTSNQEKLEALFDEKPPEVTSSNTTSEFDNWKDKYGTTTQKTAFEQYTEYENRLSELSKELKKQELLLKYPDTTTKPADVNARIGKINAEIKQIKEKQSSLAQQIQSAPVNEEYLAATKGAYSNFIAKQTQKVTIESDLSEEERNARIKEINAELSKLKEARKGLERAKMYGGVGDAITNNEVRQAELSAELLKLERTGAFSGTDALQWEIDDSKAEIQRLNEELHVFGTRPGLNVAEEYRTKHSELYEAQKKLEDLNKQKELHGDITKFGNVVNEDNFSGQWRANYRSNELAREADKAFNRYYDNPTEENKEIAYTYDYLARMYAENNEVALDDEGQVLPWLSKSLAGYLPQAKDQVVPELIGGGIGFVAGSAVGAPTAGAAAGAGIATGIQSYGVIRGSVYRELLAAGVDEETARSAASDEALISAIIEGGETAIGWLLAGSGKALNVIGTAAKKSVAKGSTNAAVKLVANVASNATNRAASKAASAAAQPLWKTAAKTGVGVVGNAFSEYGEEFLQQGVSIANKERAANDETGKLNLVGHTFDVTRDALTGKNPEARAQMHEAGTEGFKIGLMLGGSQTVVNNVVTHYANAKTIEDQNEIADTIINDKESLDALIEEGKASGKGTVSEKIATEVEKARENGTVTREQVKRLIASNEVYINAEEMQNEETDTFKRTVRNIESKQNQVSELDKTLDALSAAGEELEADDVKKATGFGDYGAKLVSDLVRDENMTFTDAKRVVATAYLAGFSGLDGKKASFETDTQINAFTAGKADRITQDTVAREKAKKAAVYDTDIKTETREVPNRESDNLAISEQFEQIDNTSKKVNTTNPPDESLTERAERIDTYIESTVASNSFAINEQHAGGRNIATMKTFFHTIHYQKKSDGSITVYVEGERPNGAFYPNEEVGTYDTVEEAYAAVIRYLIDEKGIYETYPKTFHQYNDLYNERHQNEVKIEHNKNSDKFVQKSVEKPSDAVYNNKSTDAMAKIEARQKKMQEVMSRFGLTEDEAYAVIKYKTAEAYKINAALRDDETQLNEYQKEIVQLLDSALEKLPVHRGTVYRTVSFDDLFNPEEEYNAFLEQHTVGDIVDYSAYTSASRTTDGHPMPDRIKYGVTLEIYSENARDVDGFGDNFEKEVVFPRDLRLDILEVGTDKNGRPYIKAKEIKTNGQMDTTTEEQSNLLQQVQTKNDTHGDLHEISERNTNRGAQAENPVQGVRADKGIKQEKKKKHLDDSDMLQSDDSDKLAMWTTKRVGDEVKPKSISEIVATIEHEFGINITTGHISGKGVLGTYTKNNKGIKTKIANNLPVISHELGHYFERTLDIKSQLTEDLIKELKTQIDPELAANYTDEQVIREGVAEYVRRFLQNRETAAIDYPKFNDFFLKLLPSKDLAKFQQLADDINAYYSLDADTATSSIRLREEGGNDLRTPVEKLEDTASSLYQAWVDSNHSIKRFDIATGSNAYMYASNAAYSDAIAGQIITGDLTDKNGQYISSGLKTALHGIDLNAKHDEYRLFGEYLTVKHGPERLREGMRIFADDRKNSSVWMKNRQAELEAQYPQFKEASERLYEFIKQFYKAWGVDTGLISQEMLDSWGERWEYYVPFNRVMEKGKGLFGAKRGFANQNSTIKRARGSGRDIRHPVDNIIDNIVKMVNAGTRNNVMAIITDSAEKFGANATFIEKVPMPMTATKMDMTGVKDKLSTWLEESDLDADSKETASGIVNSLDDILVQYSKDKPKGNVVTVLKGGKPEAWKINDVGLLESLTSLSPKTMNGIADAYAVLSRFMTANITGNNLIWSIFSNLPRDFATFFTYSKNKNIIKMAKGVGSAYLNKAKGDNADPLYKEFLAMGGGKTSAYTSDRNLAKNARKKLSGKKIDYNPLNWIGFASDMIETGPRFATYKLMRGAGMSPQEAFYEAMDITTNFRRSGRISKELNKVVPFFNANMQGLDKFRRWITVEELAGKPERTKAIAGRTLSYIAVSAVLAAITYAINNGDEEKEKEYEQLSNYTKNTYWVFPIGGGKYFAIPKPRDIGVLSSFFETCLEYGVGENDHAFDEFYAYASENFLPAIANDIAQVGSNGVVETGMNIFGSFGMIGVLGYLGANRDFLGRPIVASGLQNLEPKDQYTDRTSKIAYWLGQAFNGSPEQIDYFFGQVLGGWWKGQKALFPVGEKNRDWTFGVYNTYIKDNQYSTDITNWLYDRADTTARAKKSNPSDIQKAITAKWDSNMTDFYGTYYKKAKNTDTTSTRSTRQLVLDMIREYQKGIDGNYKTSLQKTVEAVCEAKGSTEYLPSVMPPEVTDGKDIKHNLSDVQYVEYQTDYLRLYWETIEDTMTTKMSTEKKAQILLSAKRVARERATERTLMRIGAPSSDFAIKYKGIANDDLTEFFADVSIASGDNSVKKSEIVDIISGMDIDSDDAWTLYLSKYDSMSGTYARDNGIDGNTYIEFLDALDAADKPTESGKYGTYTQDEAYEAIKNLKGLSRQEKAVLWQSVNLNWKAKNNPFG